MFIVFEGCEGCGKSTQLRLTEKWLSNKGVSTITTKEPGAGDIIGFQIRDLLLNREIDIDPITELFLYSSDRANHINKIINPNLKRNKLILSDRFILSTIVYQGYGRGINKDIIFALIEHSLTYLKEYPIYLWIDRSLVKSLESKRNKDRIEKETLNFHKRVYLGYQDLYQEFPNSIFRINGNQPIYKVQQEIQSIFLKYILNT